MEAYKLQLKLFADSSSTPELDAFVAIFHGFIRDKQLGDETLIDVADYAHVHEGPGIALIGHEADYFMDLGAGRLGLLYNRKRPPAGPLEASVAQSMARVLRAALLLEAQTDAKARIRFKTDEALLRLNDRLHFPNTKQTFAQLRPALETSLQKIYGDRLELMQEGSEKELFSVRIKAPGAATLSALQQRMNG